MDMGIGRTQPAESLGVLVLLASKYRANFTWLDNYLWLWLWLWCFIIMTTSVMMIWLVLSLIYWAYPGGPAWGKYRLRKRLLMNLNYLMKLLSTPPNNYYYYKQQQQQQLPPVPDGPRGFPVMGSMNLMWSCLAHHRIAAAAKKYKATRLMAFSLGETRVVATCNPDVAKEILNSSIFVDRPVRDSAYSLMFDRAIGFAPHGVYWRTLRRIAATHLFCPNQIKATESHRFEIAAQLVAMLSQPQPQNGDQEEIRVRNALKHASLNIMMCLVFGRRYYGLHDTASSSNPEVNQVRELVDQGYNLLGALNWSDHISWLADLDPQQIRFRCSQLVPKVNRFVSRVIAEHRAQPQRLSRDFVDVLLSLQGSDKLSEPDMIAVLWEMIFRGSDTMAILMEWILARLVAHGEVQSKVYDELERVVGGPSTSMVTEAATAKMVYLAAVVKEVLRLHPPGPLLSWSRLAVADTTIDGYHVPVGTTAMVDMWAIMRDPDVWSDPLTFNPERFMSTLGTSTSSDPQPTEFSVFGSDLRLAPFGSGRRTCPGKTLAMTTVTFWIASLLHKFKWLPKNNQTTVDLSEVLRLSCEMANPLTVRIRARCIQC